MSSRYYPWWAGCLLFACCNSPTRQPASSVNSQPSRPNEPPRAVRRLNLVLVTIDTMRYDRMGCSGYSKIDTRNLDSLAQRGALFENAVTDTPLTAPSHASIFTGLLPIETRVRDTGGFVLDASHPTLATILRQRGWNTAAFVGSSVLNRHSGFDQGFAVYDDRMPKPGRGMLPGDYAERRAGVVVDRAIRWLDSRADNPFFLWVHVFDPHSPYNPPSPFREKYRGRLYDGEIAYTDQQLGRLFAAIAKRSPAGQTLTVMLSDHGEGLGEHGEYNHGVFVYDSTLRIVFLLAGPGVPAGLRVRQQARTIDVLPTVLTLMGIPAPDGVAGTSLTPAFSGQEVPTQYAYMETLYPKINMGWAELRGIRTSRWKYVRAPRPELYDLLHDPGEKDNIARSHFSEVQELQSRLNTVIGSGRVEKVQTRMVDPLTMEQLRSLGYVGGASGHEYTLAGTGADPKDRAGILRLLYLAVSPDSGTSPSQRIPLLQKAHQQDPTNPTIYFYLGEQYQDGGRSGEAIKLYQEGISKGLQNGWLYSRLGSLYLQQGNRDGGIALYEKAVQLNPSDSDSLNDLGMAYLEAGKVAEAERAFRWSLAADKESALALNGLGLVSIQKHDVAAARAYFEKALRRDPDLLEAQLNLGRAYGILGDIPRERACFEAFIAKAPPGQYSQIIAKLRQELATMR